MVLSQVQWGKKGHGLGHWDISQHDKQQNIENKQTTFLDR
jgi:hypothetical protein